MQRPPFEQARPPSHWPSCSHQPPFIGQGFLVEQHCVVAKVAQSVDSGVRSSGASLLSNSTVNCIEPYALDSACGSYLRHPAPLSLLKINVRWFSVMDQSKRFTISCSMSEKSTVFTTLPSISSGGKCHRTLVAVALQSRCEISPLYGQSNGGVGDGPPMNLGGEVESCNEIRAVTF